MERNSLDKSTEQPCLTSCCRRAKGAKKVASSCTREWMIFVGLSDHGFHSSPCSFLFPALTYLQEGSAAGRKSPWLLAVAPQERIYNQEEQITVTFRMEPAGHHTQGQTAQGYLGFPKQDTSFLLHQTRQPLVLFIPQVVAQSPDNHFHCSCCLRDFLASKIGLYNSFNNFD